MQISKLPAARMPTSSAQGHRLARAAVAFTALAAALSCSRLAAQQLTTDVLAIGYADHCCNTGDRYDNRVLGTGNVMVYEQRAHFGVNADVTTDFGSVLSTATTNAALGDGYVRAGAGIEVGTRSLDTLTVTSPTLPFGTPVTLWVELGLSLSIFLGAAGSGVATVGGLPPTDLRLEVNAADPSQLHSGSFVNGLYVGYQIQLGYGTQFFIGSQVQNGGLSVDGNGALSKSWLYLAATCNGCAPPVWVNSAPASRLLATAEPEPKVFLSSASGHVYAPVPEPATWALMLAGLAAVGRLAQRRRPSAA